MGLTLSNHIFLHITSDWCSEIISHFTLWNLYNQRFKSSVFFTVTKCNKLLAKCGKDYNEISFRSLANLLWGKLIVKLLWCELKGENDLRYACITCYRIFKGWLHISIYKHMNLVMCNKLCKIYTHAKT